MEYNVLASWDKLITPFTDNHFFIGGKAKGLLKLPPSWFPRFIIFTNKFYQSWLKENDTLKILENLPSNERNLITQLFQHDINGVIPTRVIVRSNSPEEHDISSRGRYLTEIVKPTFPELALAIDKILKDALPNPIFIILQNYILGLQGHLSNERRISAKQTLWLVESSNSSKSSRINRIVIKKNLFEEKLLATTFKALLNTLRLVAGRLTQTGNGYYHCEWIWDSQRLWILQADEANLAQKDLYANKYIKSKDESLKAFKPLNSEILHFKKAEYGTWKKLQELIEFEKASLPTGDIYLLTGDKLHDVTNNRELHNDLLNICKQPVVIRCDIASNQTNREDVLLPTSDPIGDPQQLIEFINQQTKTFIENGIPRNEFAFLLAQLVPARASAWVHAYPNGQQVIIDSLWGFPDGLLFLPHDTFVYDVSNKNIRKIIRYKGLGLFIVDNKWSYSKIGPPYDWLPVLQDDEIHTLAQWGLKLAKTLDSEVQLMCLARIGGIRGPQACLPWHYTTFPLVFYEEARPNILSFKGIEIITSENELQRLSKDRPSNLKGILIKPIENLRRSANFIRRVAKFASETNIPLLFEGSLLSHSYYIMMSEGAQVVLVTSDISDIKTTIYQKLVRDKIPNVVQKAGITPVYYTLNKLEAIKYLKRKLIEESFEVWESLDNETLAEELADVLEVLESLRENISVSREDLENIQERKRNKRGGFEKLIFLKETVSNSLKSIEIKNRSLPQFEDDAPQIKTNVSEESYDYLKIQKNDSLGIITEFSVPLIPPVDDGKAIFGSNNKDVKIVGHYENGRLIITVSKKVQEREDLSNQMEITSGRDNQSKEISQQLSLFPEDITDV